MGGEIATRGLSAESAAQVRAEIQQHYDSACEAGDDAIAALGDPRAANRAYRKVLLTEQEAKFLDNMLYDLRLLYVQVSQRQPAPGKK